MNDARPRAFPLRANETAFSLSICGWNRNIRFDHGVLESRRRYDGHICLEIYVPIAIISHFDRLDKANSGRMVSRGWLKYGVG
jgi:hypothetical protein